MPLLGNVRWKALELALDGLTMRQQAIAGNLANAETPGYKALQVSFEGQLRRALEAQPGMAVARTHPDHLRPSREAGAPRLSSDTLTSLRPDGNNVDLDREMVMLADTALTYQTLTRVAARRLAMLKAAITDGRLG